MSRRSSALCCECDWQTHRWPGGWGYRLVTWLTDRHERRHEAAAAARRPDDG